MLVEWGGDSWASADNFMNGRTNGVATYRNYDFFGLVDGLDFAIQYQGKNSNRSTKKQNGDGYALSVDYNINGLVSLVHIANLIAPTIKLPMETVQMLNCGHWLQSMTRKMSTQL